VGAGFADSGALGVRGSAFAGVSERLGLGVAEAGGLCGFGVPVADFWGPDGVDLEVKMACGTKKGKKRRKAKKSKK
jgi:hypothetical protein